MEHWAIVVTHGIAFSFPFLPKISVPPLNFVPVFLFLEAALRIDALQMSVVGIVYPQNVSSESSH